MQTRKAQVIPLLPHGLNNKLDAQQLLWLDPFAPAHINEHLRDNMKNAEYVEKVYEEVFDAIENEHQARAITSHITAELLKMGKPYSHITLDLTQEGYPEPLTITHDGGIDAKRAKAEEKIVLGGGFVGVGAEAMSPETAAEMLITEKLGVEKSRILHDEFLMPDVVEYVLESRIFVALFRTGLRRQKNLELS